MKKRILSMILAIVMVAGMLPAAAFAAETDNLCDHHTEHTADCGYAPAVEGSPCTHVHDDACGYAEPIEEVLCACVAAEDGTLTHAEGCGYVEAVAGSDCTHVHDEACGYAAAVEEQPCTYECAECAAVNEEPSEVTAAEITGLALIVDGTEHSSGLVTLTAASTVELKVYGTNLQYGTNDQQIWHRPDADVSLDSVYSWVVSSDGTYATISRDISDFCNIATPHTLQYSNNGKDFYDSNVSVIYDSSEDAAITGVSITVDGETCSSGNVTIYSDSVVTITVAGSNLQNATSDQMVELKSDGTWSISGMTVSDDGTSATLEKTGDDFEGNENFEIRYCNDWITAETWQYTGIYLTYDDGTGDEPAVAATRVIYVDESTFLASGYSHFYDANENPLTATREEQGDGWVKYTIPADAKYYLTFDGHMGGGGGGNYPVLPTNADTYDPFSDTWSCSHPGYAEGNCYLCGDPCPGHTYDNACDAECNVCSEIRELGGHVYDNACDASCNNCDDIREVGDHVYDGAEDAECNECGYVRDITPAQITGVSITIDGVVYDSINTSAEDPAVITPDSNVILTVTGTSLHNGSDDHTVDYAYGLYLYVNPDYFEISEDGTVATYEPSAGDFANSSNFEITYCNNYTDTANRTVVPSGIYLTYDDGIAEEDKAEITGMSITIDGVVYDSSNTSAEEPAVITPNTGFITITVHGTALQNCTTDHVVSYYSGSSEPILPNSLWQFEADGTGAYHYYSSASALSDFANNTTPYELQYSNNGSFNAANPAIGSGVYIVYDDSTGDEEPASCTCVTKCAEGSVNSECTVCSAEGADLNGCTGEEATADDEVKQTYAITVNASQNGSVIADEYAIEGDTVTLYVSPYLGYVLDTLSVTDAEGNAVTVENNKFTMPASAVTVSAAFVVCDHKDSQYKYYDNGDGYHDATCTACHNGSLEPHTIDSTTGECEKCGAKCTHNNFDSATGNCTDCVTPVAIAKIKTGETTIYYQTAEELSTAVDSYSADQTITLLADFAVITDLAFHSDSEAKNTLDLNGHTIYSDYSARIVVYCGELTITGTGSIDVFMTANDEGVKIVVGSGVTLNDTLRSVYGGVLDLSNATIPEAGLNVILYTDDYMSATYNVSDVLLLPEDYYFFVDGKVVSSYSEEITGTVLKHTDHSYNYTDNGDGMHDAICTACGAVVDNEAHSGGTATCTELAECQHCGASYGEVDADAHSYGDWDSNGDGTHTRTCANDSTHTENGDCSGGTATCTTLAVCDTCGASYGEVNANNHNWENGVCTYECSTTHDPHTFENGICTVCGKEDTTPAEITGVTVTVDGVPYTSGDVTITPETKSIIVTVTGTHFANLSDANILDLGPGLTIFMDSWRWEIDSAANTATADFSDINSEFGDHNGSEIMYSNDSNQNWTGTGIYLTYDDGTGGEEDTTPAQITGVSITVDGETYTSGNVTITPTSTIILTVTGTNLQNGSDDHRVDYANGVYQPVKPDYFEISEDGTTATSTLSAERFANSSNFEITYCNNDTDTDNRTAISTGIYLTYDDEVNTTLAIGDNEIADGYTYTYTAEQDGSLYITVTELYYRGIGDVNEDNLGSWCAIEINGTAITEFANSTEVKTGDTVTVELISLDNDTYNGTVNLSWDASVMAEITGVSITVDGEEYVGSDTSAENPAVITSEAASVLLTVHGTNLQYATGDQWVSYMSTGNCVTLDNSDWTKSEDGSLASLDLTFLTENFTQSVSTWEIKYSNDGGGLEDAVTGLHVKYEHIPEEALWGTDGDKLTNGGTFAEAIAAAGADSDITYIRLGADVSDDWGYEIESGVFTLDLNGHTLKADQFYALTLKNAGTVVTLTDTAGGGAAIGGHVFAAVLASDGAKALINGGSYSGLDAVSANSGGFVEINGGSFTANGGFAVAVGESSNAEITGGSFSGAFCSVNSAGTTTITGGSFGVGTYGHFAYSEGKLDLSGYDQEKLIGLKLSYRTENELTVSDENIKLPEGYVFKDSEDNTVTTLTGYIIYTIGAAGTADEEEPIVIIQQPTDGEAKLGERYCVEVLAEGEGLKYQWYFRNEGATRWSKSSVTDNTYDDVMTTARMNRQVYCVITDASGNTVTTDTAKLLAIKTADLAITKEPESVTVNYGERFTVTAEAVGDGVTYEWYYLDPDGVAWLSTNVRSATYSGKMSEKNNGRAVYCVARDIWGEQVATGVVFLSCERAELAITRQPANASAKLDEMFNVEFLAEGDGLKYQWYWRTKGQENWNVSGQRDNTYDDVMTSARHNREVYCVITDAWGESLETDVATITGIPEVTLAITGQPESQTVTLGDMFNVNFEAVGDGLKYQWYFKNSGTDTWYKSGQRDNSYDDVMTKARHDRSIYCVVTDAWGNTVTTETVLITAAPKHELAITAQPNDASAKLGENFCVTVEAQGDELRYQWYWRTKGQENWNVSGQRDNTYDDVMTKARHNREVYCVITDMWGKSVETEIALITGIPTATLAITQQPTDAEAALGETFCAGVEAQGDGLSYQWYFRNAGSSVWHKSGVTDNTYDDVMTKTRAGREIYCVITDAWGNTVTTETVTLIRTET